jgi:hypothetical protein
MMDDAELISQPMRKPVEPASSADVRGVRNEMETAKRDLAGFIEGDTPQLSIQQAVWIATRSEFLTDMEACAQTGIGYGVVAIWRQDPKFEAVLQQALDNKREGFRLLGTQLLPKALLTIYEKLDSTNERSALAAAKMLIESQGMMITTINKRSKDSIVELVAYLREPQPVIANTTPREAVRGLPSPEDLEGAND